MVLSIAHALISLIATVTAFSVALLVTEASPAGSTKSTTGKLKQDYSET